MEYHDADIDYSMRGGESQLERLRLAKIRFDKACVRQKRLKRRAGKVRALISDTPR